jgi:hypothetical protein
MAPVSSLLKTYIAATAAAKHPVPQFLSKEIADFLAIENP